MQSDFGRTETRKFGKAILGTVAIAGLAAILAQPASAESKAPKGATPQAAENTLSDLPTLGRHVRRAARLNFNVSLKIDEEDATAKSAKRPSLARFVRARGHGSEATTVDSYGPSRLVESVTFPAGAPLEHPRATAMADMNNSAAPSPLSFQ